jgi:hypothetical protein
LGCHRDLRSWLSAREPWPLCNFQSHVGPSASIKTFRPTLLPGPPPTVPCLRFPYAPTAPASAHASASARAPREARHADTCVGEHEPLFTIFTSHPTCCQCIPRSVLESAPSPTPARVEEGSGASSLLSASAHPPEVWRCNPPATRLPSAPRARSVAL